MGPGHRHTKIFHESFGHAELLFVSTITDHEFYLYFDAEYS